MDSRCFIIRPVPVLTHSGEFNAVYFCVNFFYFFYRMFMKKGILRHGVVFFTSEIPSKPSKKPPNPSTGPVVRLCRSIKLENVRNHTRSILAHSLFRFYQQNPSFRSLPPPGETSSPDSCPVFWD